MSHRGLFDRQFLSSPLPFYQVLILDKRLKIKPCDYEKANKNFGMSVNPLLNPVVLDLVFAKLPTPELKKVRSVCREWDDVGATELEHRKAKNLFRYEGIKLSEPAAVEENFKK
ncbi:hypothetical protein Fcan01_19460 [Folsomia candida]|uniref:F-box domain-containing protein n=1 Tax=Folsomia candida TaxID=158441 RepID=A0A226DL76_FOLCA|nr:hypothetical protein Fcan01_19460 [Folsomia candida]